VSDLENASSPAVLPALPRTWDFLETVFVTLIAVGVFELTAEASLTIMLLHDGVRSLSPAQVAGAVDAGQLAGRRHHHCEPSHDRRAVVAIRMAR